MLQIEPKISGRIVTATRTFTMLLIACAAVAACSSSYTDDPRVAAIQQLRQDAAVTLPADVAEEYDVLLAQAVDDYVAGNQSAADGDAAAATSYYRSTRNLVGAYMDGLDDAVRARRAEVDDVQPLTRQAESIVRQIDGLITGEPVNDRPVANAGGDRTITNQTTVQLDGSASRDTDGDPLTYRWSLASAPANSTARFSDPAIVNPAFSFDQAGTYEVVLVVNDGIEDSAPDTASIEVRLDNSAPIADAGPDQTVTVGANVTLDGTGSSDADGDTLTYAWTLTGRPAGSSAQLAGATAARPEFVVDLPGSYVAMLVVNDGVLDSQPASVTIDTRNSAPVADAGMDRSVAVGDRVMLDGSASNDVDGDRLEYRWSFKRRPAGSNATLSDASAVDPAFDVDRPGRYEITLIVSDGITDSSPDTVEVSTVNSAPVADAGPDQSTFVGEVVTLDGTASTDADGDPLTFDWSLTSVPAGSNAKFNDRNSMQPSFVADLPGTYVAQLIVNDGDVDGAPDTATVTTENSPPVAAAGDDQEAFVGDIVTLDGRGSSDADFDDLTYRWSFTTTPGGSNASITDATAAVASFVPDRKGQYVVQLIVNDGEADSAPDTARIRVFADSDGDGLTDTEEEGLGTDPNDPDTDDDGIQDGDEINLYGTDPTDADSDNDDLTDGDEVFVYGTDPLDKDTDNDKIDDGEEIALGTDPLKKNKRP